MPPAPRPPPPHVHPAHGHSPASALARPSPEIESWWASPTIWLHRPMAVPTPPPRRLGNGVRASPSRRLAASGRALVARAGVLRARGEKGRVPVGRRARAAHQARRGQAHEPLQRSRSAPWSATTAPSGCVGSSSACRRPSRSSSGACSPIDASTSTRAGGQTWRPGIDVRVLVLLRYLATGRQVTGVQPAQRTFVLGAPRRRLGLRVRPRRRHLGRGVLLGSTAIKGSAASPRAQ